MRSRGSSLATRSGGGRGLVAAAGVAAMLLGAACSPPSDRRIDTAELWVGHADRPPADALWRWTHLPDYWGVARRRAATEGWYRFFVAPERRPDEPWLVLLPGLALNAEVFVNGASIGSGGRMTGDVSRNVLRPLAFVAPAPLWHAGRNEVWVHLVLTPGSPGSLHPVLVGPAGELAGVRAAGQRQLVLRQASALLAALVGAILLYSSAIRPRTAAGTARGDAAAGWLGAALLLVAGTSFSLFAPHAPLPPRLVEWSVGVGWNLAFLVLGIAMQRATGVGPTRRERLFLAGYGVASVVYATVPWIWAFPFWVAWTSFSGGILVIAFARVVRHAFRTRSPVWIVGCALGATMLGAMAATWLGAAAGIAVASAGALLGGGFIVGVAAFLVRGLVVALRAAEDQSGRLEARVAEREAELAVGHERIRALERAQVVGAERERMTREMHDGTGGLLVAALSLARRDPHSSDLEALLEDALDDLRLTLDSLQPSAADLPTLLGLLRPRLERQVRSAGLELVWRVSDAGEGAGLEPEAFLDVVRIVQETTTNAARHSGGTRVVLETGSTGDGGVSIEIRDDGAGGAEGAGDGRGLAHLRQRAARLGARLAIDSSAAGTSVRLELPPGPSA